MYMPQQLGAISSAPPLNSAQSAMFQPSAAFPDMQGSVSFNATPNTSFKGVMASMLEDTNKTLALPDQLMNRAMTTGDVDVHDVMIANTKADIAVNIASQVVTKVLQAYDRVQQIQV